jgi:hypothetical protein
MKKLCQIVEINLTRNAIRAIDTDSMLRKHYKYPKITGDEHKAIRRYQGTSLNVNHYLWEKHKGIETHNIKHPITGDKFDNDRIGDLDERIRHLDNTMKQHGTPSKLTVYSGTIHDPREHMNKEGIVHHSAYLSTSVDQKVAHSMALEKADYGNKYGEVENINKTAHVLKIHIPKGHPSIYCPGVDTQSSLTTEEKELVLPRGSNLKYMKTVKPNFPMSKENHDRTFVHHMRVVP